MVDFLFTDDWATDRTPDDLAFDHFVLASMTNPTVAQAVRATYELLTQELAAALARDQPDLHPDQTGAPNRRRWTRRARPTALVELV